jgi:hypothetical protein
MEQVYRMRQLKKSPRDFGLYVMKHPDSLLITAKNKMRSGTEVTFQQSLAGCLREAYTVSVDETVNKKNFALIEEFWKRGFDGTLEDTEKKGLIARDVPVRTIEDFLLRFETHDEWQQEQEFAIEYLHAISKQYPVGDVLLISPSGGEGGDQPHRLRHQLRAVGDGQPKDKGWHLNKDRVASRGDESLGLTNQQKDEAKANAKAQIKPGGTGEPSDAHFRAVRDKPLLMIHSLKARKLEEIPEPVATFGISFPYGGDGTSITVVANKVWIAKNTRSSEEEGGEGDEWDD